MKKLFKNKKVLLSAVLASTLLMSACGGTENASNEDSGKKSYNLVVSHFLPGNHPIETQVFKELETDLNNKAESNFEFEMYPANALGDPGAHYDMVVTGEADIGLSVHGYTPGRFPLVSVLELPFLVEKAKNGATIIANLYSEFPEIQAEHSETYPLFIFTPESAQLVSTKYKIEKPEDLKGLRVRTPSQTGAKILEALGATPVSIPMPEVYEALQRGVVDAAFVPLEALKNFNFYEIVKYVTIGNFSAQPFFSVMNKDKFESFSDADKEALNSLIGTDLSIKAGSLFDVEGQEGLELTKNKRAEIIELTGDTLKPWEEALKPVAEEWIKEMEGKGLPGKEIYERAMELKNEVRNK